MTKTAIQIRAVEDKIFFVRGLRVMLDNHIAILYGVKTKVLTQAVKRNIKRFPSDFMFRLAPEEEKILRSQIVTSSLMHGGRRNLPYAFTENGVAMLSRIAGNPSASSRKVKKAGEKIR